MKQGLLVVLEGNEYVGKTTQREAIAAALEAQGFEVVRTREPGGTPFAERTRELLLASAEHELSPVSEIFLIAAGRRDHFDKVVIPAIKAGKIVLCDRHVHSTFAWQVWPFRETCPEAENAFYSSMQVTVGHMGVVPQMFLLNISPEERERRQKARGEEYGNAFDTDPRMPKVNEAYENFKQDPSIIHVDAERDASVITDEIVAQILTEYETRQTGSQHITQDPPLVGGEDDHQETVVDATNLDQPTVNGDAEAGEEIQKPVDVAQLRQQFVDDPFDTMLFNAVTNPAVMESKLEPVKTVALLRKWANDTYTNDLTEEQRKDPQRLMHFAQFLQQNAAQMLSGEVAFIAMRKSFEALPADESGEWLKTSEAKLDTLMAAAKATAEAEFELADGPVIH